MTLFVTRHKVSNLGVEAVGVDQIEEMPAVLVQAQRGTRDRGRQLLRIIRRADRGILRADYDARRLDPAKAHALVKRQDRIDALGIDLGRARSLQEAPLALEQLVVMLGEPPRVVQ